MHGHKDANVTRAVYVREIADARRRAARRSRMVEEYGSLLEASDAQTEPADARLDLPTAPDLQR